VERGLFQHVVAGACPGHAFILMVRVAEHREILREALFEWEQDFAPRAKALRQRLRSTVDSSEIIRADRDSDATA
jgi:hypothetical protein